MRKTALLASGAVAVLALGLAGCGSSDSSSASGDTEWPDEITISLVPSTEGEDLAEALDPLTEYLSDGLGIDVHGVVANNYAATVEALGADQAQVIISDAGSLYNAIQQYGAKLIDRDVRFGATTYSAVAYTNDPDKYCDDDPVMATYEASGIELSYCNGLEEAGASATGEGPKGIEHLADVAGAKVALQAATSPAGYQYPIVAMQDEGIDTDSDITQIPVEGNNNAVLAVANGDAEVGFAYWDARTTVTDEVPDIADKAVAFAYTEPIPNGGVAASSSLPSDLTDKLATLLADYAESSDEAAGVMFDLVGLSDWTTDTNEDDITRYGEILEKFSN
ncbi:phosphate/phosphite/phosphonate ABC transporter substrate-binding protein [Microbacterium indicum]|uniref:phosphate/phosphite/phosphonate ABC transporter substrate-binding protein n=1 Tax=Microbacterium indicum TaxID=358100 RepID=UPI0004291FCB|nr:PhnD/SsuA/transferrin family substrate-binding protein [Microbacterium indicum]